MKANERLESKAVTAMAVFFIKNLPKIIVRFYSIRFNRIFIIVLINPGLYHLKGIRIFFLLVMPVE